MKYYWLILEKCQKRTMFRVIAFLFLWFNSCCRFLLTGSSASGSSQSRQKADKGSDKKSISESGSETDASSLALYPPQTTNLQPSHVNLPTTTGQNIPGQNIPGQNIPGQNIPGQNLPGQMHG